MAEGFIKAYCETARQYYGLRVENIDGQQRVTDYYDIESSVAKTLGSTVDVTDLQSADNLRACFVCGARRVGGCDCAKRTYPDCKENQGYRYQCLYCKNLRIFTREEGAEESGESRVGDTVVLAQGQVVEIASAGSSALEHILVGVNWDIADHGENMDVDSSVFVFDNTRRAELIYFGNKVHSTQCVVHMGDNLVGGKYDGNQAATDSENINVYLNKVPPSCDQMYFVVNIYNSNSRHQTLKDVKNLYIKLTDVKTKKLLVTYHIDQAMMHKTGIVIARVFRSGSKWMFKALGNGVSVEDVQSMLEYCHD